MDYSYIFRSAKLKEESLSKAGFNLINEGIYSLRTPLSDGSFFADFSLSIKELTLTVQVYDSATSEKYALFDNPKAHGSFVGSLREEVNTKIQQIKSTCFESRDLKEDYFKYLQNAFSAQPDYPWPDSPDYCVFRCPNQKWFALVMKVKYHQLGLTGEEEVWVVNMKAPSQNIQNLVDQKSIFPAWHMNKKHWITVLLTAATDFENLCKLTQDSYLLVSGKEKS